MWYNFNGEKGMKKMCYLGDDAIEAVTWYDSIIAAKEGL